MALAPIQLPIRSNRTKSGFEGDARIINGYVEDLGADAKQRFATYAMPGLNLFATLASATNVRAALAIGAKLYVVAGKNCYVVDTAGSSTNIGGVPTDGPVYMVRNRRQPAPEIGIVSDGLYYVIDTNTDTLTQVTDVNLPPASSIAVLDGYFILPGFSSKWFITGVDDATNIDGLDFASAESSPDDIVRAIEFNREIWLFGEESTEVWQNVGSSFPFVRTSSFGRGCLAPGSVAEIDEKLIWVADDGTVRMTNGAYDGQQISDHGVERAIKAETDKAGMTATTWSDEGHHFYVLVGSTFTYQFDTKSGWTERQSYGLDRWRITNVTEFDGKLIAGDYTNGRLYEMSSSFYDEAGTASLTQIHLPPVHAWPNGLIFDRLYVDIHPGVGLNTTNAANKEPELMIDWSDDGGQSWKGGRVVKLGQLGKTQTRVKINRLGSIRRNQRTFRLSMSADVQLGIFGAAVHARPLRT